MSPPAAQATKPDGAASVPQAPMKPHITCFAGAGTWRCLAADIAAQFFTTSGYAYVSAKDLWVFRLIPFMQHDDLGKCRVWDAHLRCCWLTPNVAEYLSACLAACIPSRYSTPGVAQSFLAYPAERTLVAGAECTFAKRFPAMAAAAATLQPHVPSLRFPRRLHLHQPQQHLLQSTVPMASLAGSRAF